MKKLEKETILLIVLVFAAIGFFLILIWSEWVTSKICSEGRKRQSELEYRSWRLGIMASGLPTPDTWEESERKLNVKKNES